MPLVTGNKIAAIIGSMWSINGNINIAININDISIAVQSGSNPANVPAQFVDGHYKTNYLRSK